MLYGPLADGILAPWKSWRWREERKCVTREKRWETYRCFTSCRYINTAGLDNNAQSWKKRVDRTGTKNTELMIKRNEGRKPDPWDTNMFTNRSTPDRHDEVFAAFKQRENCYCSSLCHCHLCTVDLCGAEADHNPLALTSAKKKKAMHVRKCQTCHKQLRLLLD